MMPAMLDIKNLSVSYGAIEALRDVNLSVEKGSIVAIVEAASVEAPVKAAPTPAATVVPPAPLTADNELGRLEPDPRQYGRESH